MDNPAIVQRLKDILVELDLIAEELRWREGGYPDLEDFEWSVRIRHVFADEGITTVRQLAQLTPQQAVGARRSRAVDAQVFDAAMLDMNLNGTKSFPVADKLAALGVPFIFATGYSAKDMRDGCHRPLLKKPIRYAELAGIFARLLSRPSGAIEA